MHFNHHHLKQIYWTHQWDLIGTTTTTTPGHNKLGSNGYESVLDTPKRSRTGASPVDVV